MDAIQLEMAQRVVQTSSFSKLSDVKLVGGFDISFNKDRPNEACACLVVTTLKGDPVYYRSLLVQMEMDYVPGYLGFREVGPYKRLWTQLLSEGRPNIIPDVVLVDGYGVLHHRGAGSATQLGLELGVPTIGVGKTLLAVDGLLESTVRLVLEQPDKVSCPLIGESGKMWGYALASSLSKPAGGPSKPIYISVGHLISPEDALAIVQRLCRYRVPEPIRHADINSRAIIWALRAKRKQRQDEEERAWLAVSTPTCYSPIPPAMEL
jgi:deoxyinosine 3'endonuclease (endonuclease V)